jgi:hypothetical protein
MPLFDEVMHGLGADGLGTLGRSLGLDARTVETALSAGIPVLISALAHNASTPEGSASLFGAIERNHNGSIFDTVSSMLSGGLATLDGERILGHAMGGQQRTNAANAIGRASGIDAQKAFRLLATVAPFVLGALGRARQQGRFGSSGLGSYLSDERDSLRGRAPEAMAMLSKVLDTNHDGSALDEIARIGGQLLASFRA